MAPATADPLRRTFRDLPAPASQRAYTVAGIPVTVYGLAELAPAARDVAVLWLLHPRLQAHACMAPLASAALAHWDQRRRRDAPDEAAGPELGLIAVAFDQRNHGAREARPLANEAWRGGNETHAQDMFSIYRAHPSADPLTVIVEHMLTERRRTDGTALDASQLMTYLAAYVFPDGARHLASHLVLGVSLGGHAAWQCALREARVATAVAVIGCPDYARLMADRARLSRRASWTACEPPGAAFLGSADFPPGLVQAVQECDPAGVLLGSAAAGNPLERDAGDPGSAAERSRLAALVKSQLRGKRILSLSGGADKLVPYRCSEPFVRWLQRAIRPGGWCGDAGVVFEDAVFDEVGHEMTLPMVDAAMGFIGESLWETAQDLRRQQMRSSSKL